MSLATTIFGWIAAIVAAVAFVAGPAQAATIAGQALSTIGITAGALFGGADNLMAGFNAAKDAGPIGTAPDGTPLAPAPPVDVPVA